MIAENERKSFSGTERFAEVNCQALGVAFSFIMGHWLAFGVAFSVIMRHCSAFGVAFSVNVLDKKYQSDALSLLKYTIKMAF